MIHMFIINYPQKQALTLSAEAAGLSALSGPMGQGLYTMKDLASTSRLKLVNSLPGSPCLFTQVTNKFELHQVRDLYLVLVETFCEQINCILHNFLAAGTSTSTDKHITRSIIFQLYAKYKINAKTRGGENTLNLFIFDQVMG